MLDYIRLCWECICPQAAEPHMLRYDHHLPHGTESVSIHAVSAHAVSVRAVSAHAVSGNNPSRCMR